MRLVWGIVGTIEEDHHGLQRLSVTFEEEDAPQRAMCYPALTGACVPGDRVLVNTTAVDLGLGTGGSGLVAARIPAGRTPEGVALDDASGGHIMKLRYTPLQRDVLTIEEPDSPHHDVMASAETVTGMPVVCCGLHSQVPAVAAAIKGTRPDTRVVYVMTDEATLAIAMSDTVRACEAAGLLDVSITCGQAFGGTLEAVSLHSGLLAARHVCEADVAIVAIGPGVAGTGTLFGHGGVAQGETINAAFVVGGLPVACLRVSFADARQRHRGVSHHTLTALTRVALAPAIVAVPLLPDEQAGLVDEQLEAAGVWERHERAGGDSPAGTLPDTRGVVLETMGRSPEDAPAFFAAATAAGEVAVRSRAY